MKVCAVVNPAAGQAFLRPDINKALALLPGFGWDVTVLETRARHDATEFARKAVDQEYDMVVACGGDGTLNEVIQSLHGTDVALGVIPAGTANVFAREMHIPLNPVEAATVLSTGRPRYLDLGMADDHYFLLWAGVGFDAEVLRNIRPKAKRRFGVPAFVLTALLTAFRFDGTRAEITMDDKQMRRRLLLAVLSNIKHYALFELTPQAEPDDGLFDVCLFEGRGLTTKLRHLVSFALRRHYHSPEVEIYTAGMVSLRPEKPLPVQTDGDVIGQTPMSFRVVPHALKVILPIK